MSIVAVHGPYTMGSTSMAESGPANAQADPANGLAWTFSADPSTRPAADFDWSFPGGTPATQADSKGPVAVTYATGGTKTVTLTVSGANPPPPVNGVYVMGIQAKAGAVG
jgi:PKD repeat protein